MLMTVPDHILRPDCCTHAPIHAYMCIHACRCNASAWQLWLLGEHVDEIHLPVHQILHERKLVVIHVHSNAPQLLHIGHGSHGQLLPRTIFAALCDVRLCCTAAAETCCTAVAGIGWAGRSCCRGSVSSSAALRRSVSWRDRRHS